MTSHYSRHHLLTAEIVPAAVRAFAMATSCPSGLWQVKRMPSPAVDRGGPSTS